MGSSLSPASMAMACIFLKFKMYCSIIASGALAAHLATTAGCTSPSLYGRSKNSGGFFGLGDHAAADAIWALVPKSAWAKSAALWIASAFGDGRGVMFADMQHGLRM